LPKDLDLRNIFCIKEERTVASDNYRISFVKANVKVHERLEGSFHNVDSSEAAFKIAASKAFHNAKPVLLEPIVNIEVTIPSEFMGDITGNLSSRRGRIQGMDSFGQLQVVKQTFLWQRLLIMKLN
jgi:translation elongation factor EF-G